MKRWIFTILLFLLLGAIVNIAVAWGCALYFDPYANVGRTLGVDWDPGDGRAGDIDRCLAPASTVTYVLMRDDPSESDFEYAVEDPSAFLPHWLDKSRVLSFLHRVINSSDPDARWSFDGTGVVVDERGWPCRSLWLAYTPVMSGNVTKMRGAIVLPHRTWQGPTGKGYPWGFDSMSMAHVPPALPLRAVPLGFAINTLFYGVILWLVIPGPFVLRRLIRMKRGRCPKCGYDLRGAPSGGGCPECGWNRRMEAMV
jgi:hypothetical protein